MISNHIYELVKDLPFPGVRLYVRGPWVGLPDMRKGPVQLAVGTRWNVVELVEDDFSGKVMWVNLKASVGRDVFSVCLGRGDLERYFRSVGLVNSLN